ncbi:hypothetical protein WR25_02569 [Diploscapter pachys]|uniref:5' nucleotidase family protein n=1 Tax=Diploscapter pachys TaxID=2018661 RepID=A0A2A2LA59_9BILA|nr:hypothetical protein WR25_02569 [Diploscapter pachys]
MSYILGTSWRSYFDFVFVNGDKPRWFAEDIKFKEIDTQTGVIHLGNHEGELRKEKVYSGGSAAEFRRTTGMTGKDTLYVGDHIYGDVHKSKKISGIRTLLIIPELDVEEQIWKSEIGRVYQLAQLQEKMYTSSDAQYIHPDTFAPVRNEARVMFKEITDSMELKYGTMGSLMRHGIHQTHFAYAARKYADIYTSNVYNLLRYNLNTWHFFVPSLTLLPHERNSFENIENNNSTENLLANGNGNGVELEHINTKESDSLIQQV